MQEKVRRTFASFSYYNFRLYFIGQGISLIGNWMQIIAVSWLVLELTHSGTQLGLVTAAQFLPMLFLGLWGGLIADRFNKRHIIYVTQTVAGLLALLIGLLVVTHTIHVWMIYVVVFFMGLNMVVDQPTRQTFFIEMVGKDKLKNAVTLNSIMVNCARIVGPSIAGLLIVTVGIGQCFLLNAATYLAVLLAVKLMNEAELHRGQPARREPNQIKAGLSYILRTPVLRATLLMMFIVGTFAYEFPVILPLFATKTLKGAAGTYSAMTAMMGAGAIIGGLYTAGHSSINLRHLIKVAEAFGLSLLLLALMPGITSALVVLLLMGALSVVFISLGNTTLQLNSADSMRGRVMSVWNIAFFGTTPIGGPIIGTVADHANPRVGLAVGGLSALIAAVLAKFYGH
jgi:MFS family permease